VRIASPAIPDQIFGARVLFVAVHVADFDIPRGSAERADSLARRRVRVGAIPEGAIGDRFLVPRAPG
jgi:hypothetical protein